MDKSFYKSPEYIAKQRVKKIGNKNPAWKGGFRHYYFTKYRAIAKSLEQICQKCGTNEKLIVHHKDNNYKNNNIENLMIICRGCHNTIHKSKTVLIGEAVLITK